MPVASTISMVLSTFSTTGIQFSRVFFETEGILCPKTSTSAKNPVYLDYAYTPVDIIGVFFEPRQFGSMEANFQLRFQEQFPFAPQTAPCAMTHDDVNRLHEHKI